ncbi:unnamed protein product [marine sediment metagenome]|uniref:Uncharacterized protein n=1 Tax=marine sediment metagenome TaxID=412755 RepID=X1JVS5_9ZZZZ
MQKVKHKIKDSFLFIQLLNESSLAALNKKFGTHYSAKQVKKNVRIQRASKKFRFYKKLMETPPRFRKGE